MNYTTKSALQLVIEALPEFDYYSFIIENEFIHVSYNGIKEFQVAAIGDHIRLFREEFINCTTRLDVEFALQKWGIYRPSEDERMSEIINGLMEFEKEYQVEFRIRSDGKVGFRDGLCCKDKVFNEILEGMSTIERCDDI